MHKMLSSSFYFKGSFKGQGKADGAWRACLVMHEVISGWHSRTPTQAALKRWLASTASVFSLKFDISITQCRYCVRPRKERKYIRK